MILVDLKEQTRTLHAEAESSLALEKRLANQESYTRFLSRMLGYYTPMERLIARIADASDLGFDLVERQKTSLLRTDLAALGQTTSQIAALPLCTRLPTIKIRAHIFGCLYVLEGSTLGGQIIRREVQRRLGLTPENGCAFFAGYRERTAAAWQQFGEAIKDFAAKHPEQQGQIINAAKETFERFGEWVAC